MMPQNKIITCKALLCFLIMLASFSFVLISCSKSPFALVESKPGLIIKLANTAGGQTGGWLSEILDRKEIPAHAAKAPNNILAKIAAIDEAKILVLDLTRWQSEDTFRAAWAAMNQTALLDTASWDGNVDFLDNATSLFQSYTGNLYRYTGVFDLSIVGETAAGTISASPGLNYFLLSLREAGSTRIWLEKFFDVTESLTDTLCFGCDAPVVQITAPTTNSTFFTNVAIISGTVQPDTVATATLIVNGFAQLIPVTNGTFSNAAVLSVGTNTISVAARNSDGVGADVVTVNFQGTPAALRATLTWDTGNTDMDLQMVNPNGDVCSFINPSIAGMTLDVDDANGFGPENISVNQPITGNYTVRVVNFSAAAGYGTTATVYIFKNETLIDTQVHTFSASDANNTWQVGIYPWP